MKFCLDTVVRMLGSLIVHCGPVADLTGGARSKLFQFHAVFGKIWQNRMMVAPGELAPPPRGNRASATATFGGFGGCRASTSQWRIQDFPEVGANLKGVGACYLDQLFPKTASN